MSTMRGSRSLRLSIVLAYYLLLSATTELFQMGFTKEVRVFERAVFSKGTPSFCRKLLQSLPDYGGDTDYGDSPGRCSKEDISIFQGPTSSFPTGIPEFSVQIMNTCLSSAKDCDPIADVHVKCGWFSSVQLINPAVFRRVNYDDCLVNDGQPIPPGSILSFKYSNSFSYPLSVSSISCS